MLTHKLHGKQPYRIILVEGGPGLRGSLRYVAIQLATKYGVIEHLQVGTSVDDQIMNLSNLVDSYTSGKAIIIGHSWGAMLATLFTLRYSDKVEKLVLVGSGSFVDLPGNDILKTRLSRMNKEIRTRYDEVAAQLEAATLGNRHSKSRDSTMKELGALITEVDTFESLVPNPDTIYSVEVNFNINLSVWGEVRDKRKRNQLLPRVDKPFIVPTWIIHGDYDPHPLANIAQPLAELFSNLVTITLPKCGHYPWREKYAAELFFRTLFDIVGN